MLERGRAPKAKGTRRRRRRRRKRSKTKGNWLQDHTTYSRLQI